MRIRSWLPAFAGALVFASALTACSDDPKRHERPLPAFSGTTLDGKRIDVASMIGTRFVVFLFNPQVRQVEDMAQAVANVAALQAEHNFRILGVAMGAPPDESRAYARRFGMEFPVIDDADARIGARLGLRSPTFAIGVDAEGYLVFGVGPMGGQGDDAVRAAEARLREGLRLPPADAGMGLASRPTAPTFEAPVLDAETPFVLAEQRGRAVALLFFLHTCPHCHEVLRFMKEQLAELPEAQRPVLVGIELTGRRSDVRSQLERDDLDFFPVLFDDDGTIRSDYGVFAGVPDLFLVDAEGRIVSRVQGWRPATDGPLTRMRLARIAGAPVPMLLSANGYTGSEACGVCHQSEYDTWQLTSHASAFDTLVRHGADNDPECVSCHVVGHGAGGGFQISPRSDWLEDVGCETCHGRGGPHLTPGTAPVVDFEKACLTCHDTKHSLGFDYATFLPRISHAANRPILALPAAQRQKILAERGAVRKQLLPATAAYVGSEACRGCHAAEFGTWQEGPHAASVATLEREGRQADGDCLACHTTGHGRDGGFPSGAPVAAHEDLARVGCESCHGPGGDHVAEGSTKVGTIVSLGDKCDSCVILQICGGCHDEANDPGFEFEVLDKIEKIRHGTIEAGTGAPLGSERARVTPHVHRPDALATHQALAAVYAWMNAEGSRP